MNCATKSFSHVVEIVEQTRILHIYRLYDDDSRVLYTETELPEKTFDEDADVFGAFAKALGENLLADSPVARKLMKL